MKNEKSVKYKLRLLWATSLLLPAFGAQAQSGADLTTLYSFTGWDDGGYPYAGLVQGSDGNFYGTTSNGGTNGVGTVFKISTNGEVMTLYNFGALTNADGNPVDGANPEAGLVQGSDGNFYGTTQSGGTNLYFGTVFRISIKGAFTTLYSFAGTNDGASPNGIVQGGDGNLYGTTQSGGTSLHYFGTVFRISTNGTFTSLYSFAGTNDGANPSAGLVQGSDGSFYGTTENGGTNGSYGTVFKMSTNGTLATLYSFTGGNDGAYPQAILVQGSDGYFYGTTENGGGTNYNSYDRGYGNGTVFKISTNGALTSLCSFPGGYRNDNPSAGLVQGSDGYFYGTTSLTQAEIGSLPYDAFDVGKGLANFGLGTVYKISTNGALATLYSFTGGYDGVWPVARLVQGSDGLLYGTSSWFGQGGAGTVFRLTIVPEFQAVTLTNGTLSLTWSTEAGETYQLQYNSYLTSTNWTNLGTPIPATASTLTATDTLANAPQRFYRLVLAP